MISCASFFNSAALVTLEVSKYCSSRSSGLKLLTTCRSAVDELSHALELDPFNCGVFSFFDLGDHKETILLDFTEVHALNGAWIYNRRLGAFVDILRPVNMAHGHVTKLWILYQAAGQD